MIIHEYEKIHSKKPPPPEVLSVEFPSGRMVWELPDGRRISVPLAWYPTLMLATPEERSAMHISCSTVHWPLLDCGLGSEGILRGNKEADYFARRAWKRHAASSGKNPAFAA